MPQWINEQLGNRRVEFLPFLITQTTTAYLESWILQRWRDGQFKKSFCTWALPSMLKKILIKTICWTTWSIRKKEVRMQKNMVLREGKVRRLQNTMTVLTPLFTEDSVRGAQCNKICCQICVSELIYFFLKILRGFLQVNRVLNLKKDTLDLN